MAYLSMPRDFYGMRSTEGLRIRCNFAPSLVYTDAAGEQHDISSLEFSCKPYKRAIGSKAAGDLHDDFYPLLADGSQPKVVTERPKKGTQRKYGPLYRVNTDLRDQARILMIGDRRTVASHASGKRGSALNVLLAEARKEFDADLGGTQSDFRSRYDEAQASLKTDTVKAIENSVGETAKRMLGFLGKDAIRDLDVGFTFADPTNPFGSLAVVCKEGDIELPAETMGLGIQSAIVVGVFEALRQQKANLGTVLIEEPEMYLHPQAQRYFHRLLTELADSGRCQVIYTTHAPIFADAARFETLRLLHKPSGGSTAVARIDKKEDVAYLQSQRERHKLDQYLDQAASELLFARKVLLVEGHGDYLASRIVAAKLGVDLDAEGLSVISCGGKSAMPFFARLCCALSIPTVILHDEDIIEGDGTELSARVVESNTKAKELNEEVAKAAPGMPVFAVPRSLENVLGIGSGAADKPMRVAQALEAMKISDMPEALVAAVKSLTGR
jgi:hypothetical protein